LKVFRYNSIHLYVLSVFKWIKFVKRISFNRVIISYINQILIIIMFAKFTEGAIKVITFIFIIIIQRLESF